jgi:hypothetical protein
LSWSCAGGVTTVRRSTAKRWNIIPFADGWVASVRSVAPPLSTESWNDWVASAATRSRLSARWRPRRTARPCRRVVIVVVALARCVVGSSVSHAPSLFRRALLCWFFSVTRAVFFSSRSVRFCSALLCSALIFTRSGVVPRRPTSEWRRVLFCSVRFVRSIFHTRSARGVFSRWSARSE